MENVDDVLQVGQKVEVEIAEIDDRGKLSLHAVVDDEEAGNAPAEEGSRDRAPRNREGGGDRRPRQRNRRRRSDDENK